MPEKKLLETVSDRRLPNSPNELVVTGGYSPIGFARAENVRKHLKNVHKWTEALIRNVRIFVQQPDVQTHSFEPHLTLPSPPPAEAQSATPISEDTSARVETDSCIGSGFNGEDAVDVERASPVPRPEQDKRLRLAFILQ